MYWVAADLCFALSTQGALALKERLQLATQKQRRDKKPFPLKQRPNKLSLQVYDEAVDMWSVGAVFGELLRHAPLFPAKSELECLRMQCDLLGTPTPRIWKVSKGRQGMSEMSCT